MEAHWQAVRRTRPLGQAGCPGRAKHTPSQPGLLIIGPLVKVQAHTHQTPSPCKSVRRRCDRQQHHLPRFAVSASLMGPAVDAASANQRPRLGPFCAVIFAQGCGISLATYTRLEPCCARVQTVYEILFTCDAFQGLVLKRHRSLATKIYSFLVIKITSSLPKDL